MNKWIAILSIALGFWLVGQQAASASITITDPPTPARTLYNVLPVTQCENGLIILASYMLENGARLGEAFDVNTKQIVAHYFIEPGAQSVSKVIVYDHGEQVVFHDGEEFQKKYPDLCVLLNGSTDTLTRE